MRFPIIFSQRSVCLRHRNVVYGVTPCIVQYNSCVGVDPFLMALPGVGHQCVKCAWFAESAAFMWLHVHAKT
jgi:hypothetical protein